MTARVVLTSTRPWTRTGRSPATPSAGKAASPRATSASAAFERTAKSSEPSAETSAAMAASTDEVGSDRGVSASRRIVGG